MKINWKEKKRRTQTDAYDRITLIKLSLNFDGDVKVYSQIRSADISVGHGRILNIFLPGLKSFQS